MQAADHPTHDFRRAETSADFRHGAAGGRGRETAIVGLREKSGY
jgi:hypothetical protein